MLTQLFSKTHLSILLLSATAIIGVGSPFAHAGNASDSLLDQLGDNDTPKTVQSQAVNHAEAPVTTGDAFYRFFIGRAGQEVLNIDVRQWVTLIREGNLSQASHLWTAVETQIPTSFRTDAQAAQLYTLWKLNLNQSFFEQWTLALADSSYMNSAAEMVFEQLSTPHLDQWLMETAVLVNPKQQTILSHLPNTRAFVVTLKAWSQLRDDQHAEDFLSLLPVENKLIPLLAETAVLTHVKRNELKAAAKLIKNYIEPNIAATRDLEFLARLDLNSARILYQAGQLKAAAEFYQKIPNQSSSYLMAREELSWVYLRLNDTSHLRGEIEAFFTPALKDRFQPEVYILRSISDLKMCFYDRLDKDLSDFTKANSSWAKKIDQALSAETPPPPTSPDYYTQLAEKTVWHLEAELKHLNQLGDQSVGAALPAVGQQKHWKDYVANIQAALTKAKKTMSDEYTRQWKNQRMAMVEAIRKMRFVKVEYISQVHAVETSSGDVLNKKALVASNSSSLPASAVTKSDGETMSFPTDGELWPDEFFKLRSAAQAQCLRKSGGKP